MWARIRQFLSENQIMIVLVGLVAGLLFPRAFRVFHPWNTLMLQAIFFLSALRINFKDLKNYASDWKMNFLASGFMLLILPLAMYFPLKVMAPEWALAFLIAMSVPTGMTVALIADFFHGKSSLALIISVVTSLLAPLTMPLILKVFAGASVSIDAVGMLKDLVYAILIPFVFAFLVDRFVPKLVQKGSAVWRTLSIGIFGVLIGSIVSKTARAASDPGALHLSLRNVIVLVLIVFYFAFLISLSYRMIYWRSVSERMTVSLSMVYMNFTLALYVGDKFFSPQHVVPQLVVITLLMDAMLPFLKIFASKLIEEETLGVKKRDLRG